MNIFKILSSGDGKVHEPSVTSFIAYLLDPNQGHGLNSKVLERFLSPIVLENQQLFKGLVFKGRVCDLSAYSRFSIAVATEFKVSINNSKKDQKRDIDILIEIYENGEDRLPRFAFCIENKIRAEAAQKNQLVEELEGLVNHYRQFIIEGEEALMPKIGLIFLTPDYSTTCTKHYEEFLNQVRERKYEAYIKSVHLIWNSQEEQGHLNISVFNQLSEILREESIGLIDPIHEYTKYTIKSFMNFITTGFRSYKEEKEATYERTNYGMSIRKFYNEVYNELDIEKTYTIDDILSLASKKVFTGSGEELNPKTNRLHLRWFTINDRGRCNNPVKIPTEDSKNLFYWVNNDKKLLKKIDLNNPPEGITIYWRDSATNQVREGLVSDFYPKV